MVKNKNKEPNKVTNVTDENYNEQSALDYDSARSYLIEQSNKRAWMITYISLALVVLLSLAIILMLPLKNTQLAVIKVDKNGFVEVATKLDEEIISTNEALDKSFIGRYVKLKEQYYYETLNKDFETVQMFSSPKVSQDYINTMLDKKTGRANVLQDNKELEVKILSIVLHNKDEENIATVRIETNLKEKNSNNVQSDIKVITLTYEYQTNMRQDASLRLENPLGFIVNSYRVDEEITQ